MRATAEVSIMFKFSQLPGRRLCRPASVRCCAVIRREQHQGIVSKPISVQRFRNSSHAIVDFHHKIPIDAQPTLPSECFARAGWSMRRGQSDEKKEWLVGVTAFRFGTYSPNATPSGFAAAVDLFFPGRVTTQNKTRCRSQRSAIAIASPAVRFAD